MLYRAIDTTLLQETEDDRVFLQVKIGEEYIRGLVDTGANITCLGVGAEQFLIRNKLSITPLNCSLKTAGGNTKDIIGHLKTTIAFRNSTYEFNIFIAPSLNHPLYLGTDFIKHFKLAPLLFPSNNISEISIDHPSKHTLTDSENKLLSSTIAKFPSSEILGLGKTHLECHIIDTMNHPPIKSRHYPVSPAIQTLIDAEIDRMIDLGIIEPSTSPWASPVTLVRKPNKNRLCLDFRRVNEVTVKLAYPIPNIDGILSRLSNTRYISAIDLKDAFWQIPLEPKSREKTAFVVPGRPLYHFTVMPFGLCNAPQRMMMLMDKVIPHELSQSVFVYLDDLLVVSPDFSSHIKTLEIVADKLKCAGLTINISKSNFCFREVNYLGYIVGDACIKTDPKKTEAITNFPIPKTKRQVRGFLGLAGWYRRFIADFASIAAPISDTLRGENFKFTDEAKSAFDLLKVALTNPPVLAQPNFHKPFHLQCDASNSGIGAVLFQLDDNNEEKPLFFYSSKLTKSEKNYSVTERECLAVVKAVKKFRPYLEGYEFNIITDHHSLKWLMSTKDLSGRLARWSLKLQPYTFSIHHRKGTLNTVPDSLSRQFSVDSVLFDSISLNSIDATNIVPLSIDLNHPSFSSSEYEDLKLHIRENSDQLPDLMQSENLVYKRMSHYVGDPILDTQSWKLWIPSDLRNQLIVAAHNPPSKSHGGIAKTLARLRERFYWPYMALDVQMYIKSCEQCQTSKSANVNLKPPLGDCFQVQRPFQHLYIDFLGEYPRTKKGNTKMFIVVDQLTKFVLLEPIRSSKSPIIINYLKERVFPIFGVPETILSDNGQEFVSKLFNDFLNAFGIKRLLTPKYTPQCNASERVNRSIVEAIRCYIKDHSTWDNNISEITSALRSALHQTLRISPFEAMFGQPMVQHGKDYELLRKLDALNHSGIEVLPKADHLQIMHHYLMKRINEAHDASAKRYNLRTNPNLFLEDQEVYCRTFPQSSFKNQFVAKFAPKFRKARILKVLGKNRYELADAQGKSIGTYHSKDIKRL